MRKILKGWSKVATVLGLLAVSASFAHAQSSNSAWPVSKDVQRYANKEMFADENLKASHIQAKSTDASWTVSKGVQRKSTAPAQGNVASKGTPAWAISKGVARISK